MKITITAMMLCELLGGKMTLEACEALRDHFEDVAPNDFAPAIGDIACSYSEIPADWVDDDTTVIAMLDNGNALVAL